MHAPYHYLALLSLIAAGLFYFISATTPLRQQRDVDSETPAAAAAARSSPNNNNIDAKPTPEIPSQPESLIAMQFTSDPYAHRDRIEMIRNGELGLAAIRYAPSSFIAGAGGDDGQYTDVYGDFCVFDSSLNKEDPANYPTISAVMSKSEHCGEHRYKILLREVMEAVRDHDISETNKMNHLPVSGLLFHEGYSGAGLISNALATFDSTLVISEHPAIRDALSACDVIRNRYKSDNCSPSMQRQLVEDVISLLSRTSDASIHHLYLKLSSASAMYLPELRSLYPDAKWAFVYRRAEDALAKATQRKRNSVCMNSRRNPSTALSLKSNEYNVDLEQLSHHEICALHLSTLVDVAISEHDKSGTGMLVSYDNDILSNSNAIVDIILPYLGLQEEIDSNPQVVRDRVSDILSVRSNTSGRQNPEDKQWNVDGENIEVSEEVGAASKVFMGDSMDSMMRSRL